MAERMDQKPVASSVANTDIIILGNPSTGEMKKAAVSQVAPKNAEITLTDSSTVAWNYLLGNIAKVTLGGNRNLTISNIPASSFGLLIITQDGIGSRTLNLPGIVPPDFSLSTDPGSIDILGFYYDGTTYYWSVNGGGTSIPIVLEDITLPTVTGTLVNTSGVWSNSGSGSTWNVNRGLAGKKIAAGQDGWIQFEYTGSDAVYGIVGFNTSNANDNYEDYEYAMGCVPNLSSFALGTPTYNIDTPIVGDLFKLDRTAGTLSIQKSQNSGASWTNEFTFSGSYTGDLFICMNLADGPGKVYNFKGYNLS